MAAYEFRRAALTGAVVATLCMFPLLNALSNAPAWLHWTAYDSLETLAAWALSSLVIAATLVISALARHRLPRDIVCSAWLMIGALFVSGAVVKISSIESTLAAYRQNGGWIIVAIAAFMAALAFYLLWFPGDGRTTRIQRIAPAMWPLVLLLGYYLATAPGMASRQALEFSPGPARSQAPLVDLPPAPRIGSANPRTVILLFDELSPDYLYGARQADLSSLAALQELRHHGEIHAGARLKGGATAIAIPALFAASPAAARGLVPTLSAQGRSVHVWGWYHDYCRSLALGAAACHANSIYNPRTLHEEFSVVDPWWTDLNLLPAAFPFNLLKTPTAVALHRRTLEATQGWLAQQLGDASADVIYAHVNVPHLPLVTARVQQLRRPDAFAMSEEGYVSQFAAVDAVVAAVLASHTRPTQLIVLSDHNARPLFDKSEHEHVVFMRWRTWIHDADRIDRPENAAELVARMSLRPDEP